MEINVNNCVNTNVWKKICISYTEHYWTSKSLGLEDLAEEQETGNVNHCC